MVQFIEGRGSPLQEFTKAAAPGIFDALGSYMNQRKEKGAFEQAGLPEELAGLKPELQKSLLGRAKSKEENLADENSYKILEDKWGKPFADVWKASPVGGRTELIKAAIQSGLRKEDVEDIFRVQNKPSAQQGKNLEESTVPQVGTDGKIPADFKFKDYTERPQGYTPKQWVDERKDWRKENTKQFEENKRKRDVIARDLLGTRKLNKLNETRKVGEGFERSLINPNTGDFYGLGQLTGAVSPEAQEWVKEIARFGNRAKEAFGSRVTNFDLMQYMKQFPGLLNTYEGRKRILKMMEINYHLDELYDKVSQQILQKKGLNGISPEDLDQLTQQMISGESERLKNEYLNLDQENEKSSLSKFTNPEQKESLKELFP